MGRDRPASVLVRNLRYETDVDEIRKVFGKFGELKDVYLPKDYNT